MRNDLRVRIFDGREHPLRHRGAFEIEVGVDRADHHVQLREEFVGIVEAAVLQDVHFGSREDSNPMAFLVGSVNLFDVRGHAFFVKAIGDGDGFRMVGDGDVFVPQRSRGFRHFFDGVFAVARGGMHLQVALHVFEREQVRKFMIFRSGNFAGVFAQLGRNEIEL